MSTADNQNGESAIAAIAAIILFGILAFGSVQLKTRGLVGDPALVSLLIMSGLFGLAIFFKGRLKKFGPSGLELHEAVRDIKAAEETVKSLAYSTVELVMSLQNVVFSVPDDGKVYGRIRDSALRILDQAGIAPDDCLRRQVESMNKNEVHTA